MKEEFVKFPSTPHLAVLGDIDIRRDKVMSASEREEFLHHELVVEEKVDGANLGISWDAEGHLRAQNRGAYLHLPSKGQWKKLVEWLAPRTDLFFEILMDRYILFGEWCYAQHSVFYDRLPDWFLGFDIFDKRTGRFLSTGCRDLLFRKMEISRVPFLARGILTLENLKDLMHKSKFCDQPVEGLYLRLEEEEWLLQRAKLVRPNFIQSMAQHWSRATVKPNRLGSGARF